MSFNKEVYKWVLKIPYGKITTYGFIATLLDNPRAARAVGWALRAVPADTDIPWWRVINAQGYLSIQNTNFPKDIQKGLLEKEGIKVSSKYLVDLDQYLWKPNQKL